MLLNYRKTATIGLVLMINQVYGMGQASRLARTVALSAAAYSSYRFTTAQEPTQGTPSINLPHGFMGVVRGQTTGFNFERFKTIKDSAEERVDKELKAIVDSDQLPQKEDNTDIFTSDEFSEKRVMKKLFDPTASKCDRSFSDQDCNFITTTLRKAGVNTDKVLILPTAGYYSHKCLGATFEPKEAPGRHVLFINNDWFYKMHSAPDCATYFLYRAFMESCIFHEASHINKSDTKFCAKVTNQELLFQVASKQEERADLNGMLNNINPLFVANEFKNNHIDFFDRSSAILLGVSHILKNPFKKDTALTVSAIKKIFKKRTDFDLYNHRNSQYFALLERQIKDCITDSELKKNPYKIVLFDSESEATAFAAELKQHEAELVKRAARDAELAK